MRWKKTNLQYNSSVPIECVIHVACVFHSFYQSSGIKHRSIISFNCKGINNKFLNVTKQRKSVQMKELDRSNQEVMANECLLQFSVYIFKNVHVSNNSIRNLLCFIERRPLARIVIAYVWFNSCCPRDWVLVITNHVSNFYLS